MKRKGFLLTALVIVLCLAGCATADRQAWEKARKADNFAAYSEYIGSNPKGSHVGEARREIAKSYKLTDAEVASLANLQQASPAEAKKIEYVEESQYENYKEGAVSLIMCPECRQIIPAMFG